MLEQMNKILIVEDDTDINNMIADALSKNGYSCTQAFSGTEGVLCAKQEKFHLGIIDLMLPGMAGEALLPKLREIQKFPIIVISAKDSLESKVGLLSSGAEDYLTKPFAIEELVARVGVQIRRLSDSGQNTRILAYKDMRLDGQNYALELCGKEVALTRQEYKIVELFVTNPGRVFSKQDIYNYAWDDLYIGEDKTINVHISNIRKKLKEYSQQEYIETVWGIGFRLAK